MLIKSRKKAVKNTTICVLYIGNRDYPDAGRSGVSLRMIQIYEQRNKDINKAGALSLSRLARALGCEIDDLLEM